MVIVWYRLLDDNKITTVPQFALLPFTYLLYLSISNNPIMTLPSDWGFGAHISNLFVLFTLLVPITNVSTQYVRKSANPICLY